MSTPEAGPHQRLVVGQQDPDHDGGVPQRRRHPEAAAQPGAGLELAAVERGPLPHADQAVARPVGGHGAGRAPAVVDHLDVDGVRLVAHQHASAAPARRA